MLVEQPLDAAPVQVADLAGFAALRRVADAVSSHVTVEYWKSVPYFINFMDGYQLGDRVRAGLQTGAGRAQLEPLLAAPSGSTGRAGPVRGRIDLGSGRLRALAADTVDQGWWQLLWVPPSMPYLTPAGPYAGSAAASMTKRLIFSSWSAAPTAIAALLSYEAERRLATGSQLTSNTARGPRGHRRRGWTTACAATSRPRCRRWPCSGRTPRWPRWPTRWSSRGRSRTRPSAAPQAIRARWSARARSPVLPRQQSGRSAMARTGRRCSAGPERFPALLVDSQLSVAALAQAEEGRCR